MAATYPSWPPTLTDDDQDLLVEAVKDWSISHGLAVRPPTALVPAEHNPAGVLAVTAPVTLFPSLFPSRVFESCSAIQEDYNYLYAAVASDEAFLKSVLTELVQVDDFVARLWRIHATVKEQGYAQVLSFGLFRSDYMVHVDPSTPNVPQAKQVEFNTIASSFGGLSTLVSRMHAELALQGIYPESARHIIKSDRSSLPTNDSTRLLAQGLKCAHQAYKPRTKSSCVLFIVQDNERNVFDQRHIEYALLQEGAVQSRRLPLSHATKHLSLHPEDRTLLYTPHGSTAPIEISVVYFRAGYSPDDFTSQADWDARLLIEQSRAIKCPSILTHLAGTKKVQQVLATPGSRHVTDVFSKRDAPAAAAAAAASSSSNTEAATRILDSFAPMYPMDSTPAGQQGRKLALDPLTATRHVLKPQREGGGNNIYRDAIPPFLNSLPESQWSAYVLMEMIEPPASSNVIFRNGEVQRGGVISELGVYGCCLWRNEIVQGEHVGLEVMLNTNAGYLLRTKGDQSQEGGVAAGFGAVDSVCLVSVDEL